ncbi:MAG: DNA modification methylase, partial [Tetrasphaera sp.]|nr:DNA modification methylase [Tetrasphaera sp.]
TIPINDIQIAENRQRQEFDPEAMQELITSIEERGLMHPIVLRAGTSGEHVLVAGERRLRAIREIFDLGGKFICDGGEYSADSLTIPYTFLGDLSPLEYEEAELDENLKRKDLTWQEHAAAVARLHELRDAQKKQLISEQAEATGTAPAPYAAQTVADTARELTGRSDGYFQDSVRKELIVSKHLSNPIIAKAKSADEAFKLLRKEEARQRNVELAEAVGKVFSSGAHRVLQANCLDWMADPANAGQFDVILTDPPYGINAQDFGDGAGRLASIEHHYDDSYESWQKLITAWAELSFRAAKPQAHAYVFCDIDRFHELRDAMRAAGWYVFRTPFTIVKDGSGRVPLP